MSDVKVTREHREGAYRALHGPESLSDLTPTEEQWLETGQPFPYPDFVVERRIAFGLAAEGHRIRAAVISDLRSLARVRLSTHEHASAFVFADSIELLIEHLEAQQ